MAAKAHPQKLTLAATSHIQPSGGASEQVKSLSLCQTYAGKQTPKAAVRQWRQTVS
jgi:hypothetical protein